MSREKENACLEEFIGIYRSEICLWQVKAKSYHNRGKKEAAYLKLVEKWRKVDPSCTKSTVIKKINNLRSSFRKEMKKVKESMRTWSGADEVYQSKLWYFDLLKFVQDQDVLKDSRTTVTQNENSESEEESQDTNEASSQEESLDANLSLQDATSNDGTDLSNNDAPNSQPSTSSESASGSRFRNRPIPATSRGQGENIELTKELLATVQNHFKRPRLPEDRFDIYGRNVAMKLRDLNSEQRRLVEKIINDALFEAEGGNLTTFHKLMYQPPSHQSPVPIYYPNIFQSMHSATPSSTSYSSDSHSSLTSPHQSQLLHPPSSYQDHNQRQSYFSESQSTEHQQTISSQRQEDTVASLFSSFHN